MTFFFGLNMTAKGNKEAERQEKIEALKNDFPYYCEQFYKIIDKEKLVPFKFRTEQYLLESVIDWFKKRNKQIVLYILKPRKRGLSTYIQARLYKRASTNPHQCCICITHNPETTASVFNIAKRFHNNLPKALQPETKYDNVKKLTFNNKEGTGLDSVYIVATAGTQDFGSGLTITLAHLSELPKWEKNLQTPLMVSILNAIGSSPDRELYIEATAKGVGGEFHKGFLKAKYMFSARNKDYGKPTLELTINPSADPEDESGSVFFPWYIAKDHTREIPDGFLRTEEEDILAKKYFLTDDQLVWRRWAISNLCKGSLDIFNQEHPTTAKGAFLSSGRPVFDPLEKVQDLFDAAIEREKDSPPKRFECLLPGGAWIETKKGILKVYEMSKPGKAYIVFADISEGLERGDFTSVDVIDHYTGAQVAKARFKMDPDLVGEFLYHLGRMYNEALVVPERNNTQGGTTTNKLVNMGYKNLYLEMVLDPPNKPVRRYGWVTDMKTRPQMINTAVALMREGTHGIKCPGTFQEMLYFKYNTKGRGEAESGVHDDQVLSWAGAQLVRQVIPMPKNIKIASHPSFMNNRPYKENATPNPRVYFSDY